jgi:hypothetical protein
VKHPTPWICLSLLVQACNPKPEGATGGAKPQPEVVEPAPGKDEQAGAKAPRELIVASCDCSCASEECRCRPLRSGGCVCVDDELLDCECDCGDRPVVPMATVSGLETGDPSAAAYRPKPPDFEKRGPPPPHPDSTQAGHPPGEVHEGFELDKGSEPGS